VQDLQGLLHTELKLGSVVKLLFAISPSDAKSLN
jgi:hypothetical protein